MTGNYAGNDIGTAVRHINDAKSCQKECQKLAECKFWTYNYRHRYCYRQRAKGPLGRCNTCTRGPRNCANGK